MGSAAAEPREDVAMMLAPGMEQGQQFIEAAARRIGLQPLSGEVVPVSSVKAMKVNREEPANEAASISHLFRFRSSRIKPSRNPRVSAPAYFQLVPSALPAWQLLLPTLAASMQLKPLGCLQICLHQCT